MNCFGQSRLHRDSKYCQPTLRVSFLQFFLCFAKCTARAPGYNCFMSALGALQGGQENFVVTNACMCICSGALPGNVRLGVVNTCGSSCLPLTCARRGRRLLARELHLEPYASSRSSHLQCVPLHTDWRCQGLALLCNRSVSAWWQILILCICLHPMADFPCSLHISPADRTWTATFQGIIALSVCTAKQASASAAAGRQVHCCAAYCVHGWGALCALCVALGTVAVIVCRSGYCSWLVLSAKQLSLLCCDLQLVFLYA